MRIEEILGVEPPRGGGGEGPQLLRRIVLCFADKASAQVGGREDRERGPIRVHQVVLEATLEEVPVYVGGIIRLKVSSNGLRL
jgi:hypothetical protein